MQLIQYKRLFLSEARSRLKQLEDALLQLEKTPDARQHVEAVLLTLHGLKSDAATMSYLHLANAVHSIEELFLAAKQRKEPVASDVLDHLFMAIDAFRDDLAHIERDNTEIDLGPATAFILRKTSPVALKKKNAVEVPARKEDVYAPLASYVEVSSEQLDAVLSMSNDIIATNQQMQRLVQRNDAGGVRLSSHTLAAQASNLREAVVTMKMIPLKQYFAFISRLVRDLAREQRKFITLEFRDNNLRFERFILESIREACVQLVKNAVTHGFREGESGKVSVVFGFKSDRIFISVIDTGHGIDWVTLKRVAGETDPSVRKARMTPALQDKLLFEAGVSSRPEATLASGRGLGLQLVAQTAGALGGTITAISQSRGRGRGARFDLTVPVTPTLFRALTWRWGPYYFALPLFTIENVIQLTERAPMIGRQSFTYKNKHITVFNLTRTLGISLTDENALVGTVALVQHSGKLVALPLPTSVSEQELILQRITSIAKNKFIMGAAVSQESIPVVILNYRALFS
ncbi:MAG: hypothetical protein A3B30_02550 [Candidatus Komeilibacteria bacterium RIFCSPLOWO2_01_FULL_52_15]|uniref:histidine kinase n=2 Tax=Candidatus Komeiliibacteriota TaxID=1817908 RepID=A0A1G2BQG7_9BACT|nr:MAG: hypothetical protein A2677_01460 [Candidatus Komeilibacteria bacterium RIFCSPHIGHO2_01_FULL_52_14]OGY91383.1 MAG: hypothetical protein A3B30_02550 [Candidatus Komeilibacteria bacterium RIFCSPLOWO2_01_FULL_52_15]